MKIDPSRFLVVTRPALEAGDAVALADAVSKRWMAWEVAGLLNNPDVDVRRVAAVTLGLIGGRKELPSLVEALRDADAQVNRMAEHGVWSIWFRLGKPAAMGPFREGVSRMSAEQYKPAIECFERARRHDSRFAECYNQCAMAHFFLGHWERAIDAFRHAIRLMPCHFGAMSSLGHCYAEMGELSKALSWYRRALRVNPRMGGIERAIRKLEATVPEDNDSSGEYVLAPAWR